MNQGSERKKNHNELFPGYISTWAVTDPERIEPSIMMPLTRFSCASLEQGHQSHQTRKENDPCQLFHRSASITG